MNLPLVSIIISAYNHEEYVGACLQSMIDQSYRNIELIVLNDGSKDQTHQVISSYDQLLKERFTRYIYINKNNEGISANFNKGIRMSEGQYIKTFASDDILLPKAIERLVEFLETNPEYDIAYGDGYHIHTKESDWTQIEFDKERRFSKIAEFKSGYIYEHLLTMAPHMSTWTVLFRRRCFEESGDYDESLTCEDVDLYLRFSRKYLFGFIQEDFALHRIHGTNAGLDPNVMLPSLNKMLVKYDKAGFFAHSSERDQFIDIIDWTERVLDAIDYKGKAGKRRVVIWGTGGYYHKYKHQIESQLVYFVDSNTDKTNQTLDGKKIYLPQQLLNENIEDLFICVMSMYYKEIYEWLSSHGFIYQKQYF